MLGAIGHPDVKPGILEKGILLKARFELDQYINLRPVKLYPGVETPIKNKGPGGHRLRRRPREHRRHLHRHGRRHHEGHAARSGHADGRLHAFQVDRCLKYAFEYAKKHGKKARGRGEKNTLTLCGKTNVLTYIYGLWERAFHEMGEAQYPDIKREYYHVDATTMWIVKNPEWFDVIVTGNLFGDIITDLGAMIQGGMGIAAGGNINPDKAASACSSPSAAAPPSTPARTSSTRWRRSVRPADDAGTSARRKRRRPSSSQ